MAKAKEVPADWGVKKEEITHAQSEACIKKLLALEAVKQEKEAELELVQKQVTEQKKVVDQMLAALNKKNYAIEGLGTVTRKQCFSVKIPTSDADRKAFLKYCAGKGMKLSEFAFPGSKWLNAFVDAEYTAAQQRGDSEFKVPGIEMGEAFATISVRLKK